MSATKHANRANSAYEVREQAALLAKSRPHPRHIANREELRYRFPFGTQFGANQGRPSHLASFTKGFAHDPQTGVISNPNDFQQFILAMDSGDRATIAAVPLGPRVAEGESRFTSGIASDPEVDVRAWESMGAGLTYDLEGPDAQAVTMPPAPALDSAELVTEISECYWMALLRDTPFANFDNDRDVLDAVNGLNETEWIKYGTNPSTIPLSLTLEQRARLRPAVTAGNIFRGVTPGDLEGPYLSQFLLIGNTGISKAHQIHDGFISYGAQRVDQKVRVAEPRRDFMTTWESFMDVQNGADVRGREVYEDTQGDRGFRFISTPRDLATYVHFDALYQAYLNACLILLGMRVPFDKGLPFQLDDDIDRQQTFATFGGPHILSLVTEVATRALKAVRFQKFNVHRRLRPEAVGGLVEKYRTEGGNPLFAGVEPLYNALKEQDSNLLGKVGRHNELQNQLSDNDIPRSQDKGAGRSYLLPMAFPEGSPMHPSYGAGHATVAGACVTVLKAFFDHAYELRDPETKQPFAFVANADGKSLDNRIGQYGNKALTVEGELNKVCSNICIGRNWAGVHYFTDYIESIRVGEQIALGVLEEQKLTFGENFSMTVPLFDGGEIRI